MLVYVHITDPSLLPRTCRTNQRWDSSTARLRLSSLARWRRATGLLLRRQRSPSATPAENSRRTACRCPAPAALSSPGHHQCPTTVIFLAPSSLSTRSARRRSTARRTHTSKCIQSPCTAPGAWSRAQAGLSTTTQNLRCSTSTDGGGNPQQTKRARLSSTTLILKTGTASSMVCMPTLRADIPLAVSNARLLRNVLSGHDYKGALSDYVKVGGPIAMVPRQAMGIWWTRWFDFNNWDVKKSALQSHVCSRFHQSSLKY